MSDHTLSTADTQWLGSGHDTRLFNFWGRKGVPVVFGSKFSLGTPAVADADFLLKAATGTELPDAADPGETVTYTPATDGTSPLDGAVETTTLYPNGASSGVTVWDVRDGALYGRNLVSVATHSSAVVAMTVLISGYDYTGQAMSELHTITATGTSKTATGKKAFAYVASIAITAAADASDNTLNIGTGSVLGLPFRLADADDMIKVSLAGAQELVNVASNATVVAGVTTEATTTTGDVRGTVSLTGTLDGSSDVVVLYHVAGHDSGAGLAGVAQA